MEQQGDALLGVAQPAVGGRFPLLCKLLDARERLSLQVHPPRESSIGEPKTEMWYIASAAPGAELYVGLKQGVTRERFEAAIRAGGVEECFHRIEVRTGDAMFLPSGRVHAIGAGLVIFEIQQNSDTTFRVFDWDRVGLDGHPRELHIEESLQSIDFTDVEPSLAHGAEHAGERFRVTPIVEDPLFAVDLVRADAAAVMAPSPPRLRIVGVVEGELTISGGGVWAAVPPGSFCVLPASLDDARIMAEKGGAFLVAAPG